MRTSVLLGPMGRRTRRGAVFANLAHPFHSFLYSIFSLSGPFTYLSLSKTLPWKEASILVYAGPWSSETSDGQFCRPTSLDSFPLVFILIGWPHCPVGAADPLSGGDLDSAPLLCAVYPNRLTAGRFCVGADCPSTASQASGIFPSSLSVYLSPVHSPVSFSLHSPPVSQICPLSLFSTHLFSSRPFHLYFSVAKFLPTVCTSRS